MTQQETEQKLLELAQLMREIYRDYAGHAQYLEVSIKNGNLHIWNEYWERDRKMPIKADERVDK